MKASKSKSYPSRGVKEVKGVWIPLTCKGASGLSAVRKRENKKRKESRA